MPHLGLLWGIWSRCLVSPFILWDSATVSQSDTCWLGPLLGAGSHGALDPMSLSPECPAGPSDSGCTEPTFILDEVPWALLARLLRIHI